jgi:L-threonylcarbamoyladenylate synthase
VSESAAEAIRAGKLVVFPADTVYGLGATPYEPEPVERLASLKGRDVLQPVALMAASVDVLLECVPELRGRSADVVRALLPGPYTLVLPNPARRFRWLTGSRPDTIGVRVPELSGPGAELLSRVGALAATSANVHGGPDPRRLEDVPEEIRAACAAVVDGGELPGTASTVVDLTGPQPAVLREGAVPGDEVLERLSELERTGPSLRR